MADVVQQNGGQVASGQTGAQGSAAAQVSHGSSSSPDFNHGLGTGASQTPAWSVLDESLKAKGWKSQAEMEKSYLELERDRSQRVEELRRLNGFLERLDPYARYIEKMLRGERFVFEGAQQNGNLSNDSGSDQSSDDSLNPLLENLRREIGMIRQSQIDSAREQAIKEFFAKHPDAKQLEEEMAKLIGRDPITGEARPVRVADFTSPNAYLQALEAAYGIVKSRRAAKESAAEKASLVSGGGVGGSDSLTSSVERWKMSPEELRQKILEGTIV